MPRLSYAAALDIESNVEALAPLISGVNPDGSVFAMPTAPVIGTAATNAAASVGVTSSQVLAANAAAVERVITNDSGTATIYLALGAGPAVVGQGIRLATGGVWRSSAWSGAVHAIAAGAGGALAISQITA